MSEELKLRMQEKLKHFDKHLKSLKQSIPKYNAERRKCIFVYLVFVTNEALFYLDNLDFASDCMLNVIISLNTPAYQKRYVHWVKKDNLSNIAQRFIEMFKDCPYNVIIQRYTGDPVVLDILEQKDKLLKFHSERVVEFPTRIHFCQANGFRRAIFISIDKVKDFIDANQNIVDQLVFKITYPEEIYIEYNNSKATLLWLINYGKEHPDFCLDVYDPSDYKESDETKKTDMEALCEELEKLKVEDGSEYLPVKKQHVDPDIENQELRDKKFHSWNHLGRLAEIITHGLADQSRTCWADFLLKGLYDPRLFLYLAYILQPRAELPEPEESEPEKKPKLVTFDEY